MTQPLTPRELEVLRLLADGATSREIARELVVSVATARNHAQAILWKTGANTRLGAVAAARRDGILDPPEPVEEPQPDPDRVTVTIDIPADLVRSCQRVLDMIGQRSGQ